MPDTAMVSVEAHDARVARVASAAADWLPVNGVAPAPAAAAADDLVACEALMRGGSKSFFAASRVLPARVRAPAIALYAFCRVADDAIDLADDPAAEPVQALVARWHQHLRYFYEPTPEILRGLGGAYAEDPTFAEFFARFDPALPDFLHQAIDIYCDRLAPEG